MRTGSAEFVMAEDRHASTCGVIKRGREMTADTLQDKHPDHAIVQEKAYWAPDNNIGWSKRDLQAHIKKAGAEEKGRRAMTASNATAKSIRARLNEVGARLLLKVFLVVR